MITIDNTITHCCEIVSAIFSFHTNQTRSKSNWSRKLIINKKNRSWKSITKNRLQKSITKIDHKKSIMKTDHKKSITNRSQKIDHENWSQKIDPENQSQNPITKIDHENQSPDHEIPIANSDFKSRSRKSITKNQSWKINHENSIRHFSIRRKHLLHIVDGVYLLPTPPPSGTSFTYKKRWYPPKISPGTTLRDDLEVSYLYYL